MSSSKRLETVCRKREVARWISPDFLRARIILRNIQAFGADVFYTEGLWAEKQGNISTAVEQYEKSLTIDTYRISPTLFRVETHTHTHTIHRLDLQIFRLCSPSGSITCSKTISRWQSTRSLPWSGSTLCATMHGMFPRSHPSCGIAVLCVLRALLGQTYKAKGLIEKASECLLTALELEATAPVQPFSVVPRLL